MPITHHSPTYIQLTMVAMKSLLMAVLFLVAVGLTTQGTEAVIMTLVYGTVPCNINTITSAIFPSKLESDSQVTKLYKHETCTKLIR